MKIIKLSELTTEGDVSSTVNNFEFEAKGGPNIDKAGSPKVTTTRVDNKVILTFDYLKGNQGEMGNQGVQGTKGEIGTQGPKGDKGTQGAKGEIGDTGSVGSQGTQGAKGEIGDQGLIGEQGLPGTQGTKGEIGDTGSVGSQGTQGAKGEIGDTGSVGSQGTQGAKGEIGDQGLQGEKGEQGSPGPEATDVIRFTLGTKTVDGETIECNKIAGEYTWNDYQDFIGGAGNSSDIRYKADIVPITNILDDVLKMDVFTYTWNKIGDPKVETLGVSAQQLESLNNILAKLVHTSGDGTKSVEYNKLAAIAIRAVQEQQVIINRILEKISL